MADNNLQGTQGHESEILNVAGAKAMMQKYKTNVSDTKQNAISDLAVIGCGYSTCSTAGNTATKAVTISNFILLQNCRISVLFQNAFTASNPKLSVNGGTAISIKHFGRAMETHKVHSNTILTMVYDGTDWQVVGIESITASTPSGAVDLALPSGLLWCEHNIGAETPYEAGLYFSWGNVVGHTASEGYAFTTAAYAETTGAALTGNISVDRNYDAARHNMGAPWRLPTSSEFKELNDNCDHEWTDEDGVKGMLFTSRNNSNSIFFPAGGMFSDSSSISYVGTFARCWSSTYQNSSNGRAFNADNGGGVYPVNNQARARGYNIRAVQ